MALIDPAITINTAGYDPAEFTFAILGPYDEQEDTFDQREQEGNPVFIANYLNGPLVAGVEYLTTAYHPEYCDPKKTFRITFAEDGSVVPPAPEDIPEPVLLAEGEVVSTITLPGLVTDFLTQGGDEEGETNTGAAILLALLIQIDPSYEWLPSKAVLHKNVVLFDPNTFGEVFQTS